jgi:antitoxin ParD1/3/4
MGPPGYISEMNIRLPSDQQAWLEEQVAKGAFTSIEDAVQQMVAERMALEGDDLAWAKSYVDEALEAVARGEVKTLEEHRTHIAKLRESFKR